MANAPTFSEAPFFLPASPSTTPTHIPTEMRYVPTLVDSEMAMFLLQRGKLAAPDGTRHQVNARPISWPLVRRFEEDMIDGRWRLTHEAIAISAEGKILDGQHRLWAVLEAYRQNPDQKPIPMLVCYNADPESFVVVNTGKSRNPSDIFAIDNVEYPSRVAPAARLLYCHLATRGDHERDAAESGIPVEPNKWSKARISTHRLRDVLIQHPGLMDDVDHSGAVANASKLASAGLIAARYLIVRACGNREAVHDFYEILRTGQDAPYRNHPAFTLRDWALRQRMKPEFKVTRKAAGINKGPLHMRLIVAAWNHACRGNALDKISYKVDGLMDEPLAMVPVYDEVQAAA